MRRIALCVLFSLVLCSCAPKYNTVTPSLRTQMLGDLAAGKLALDCGIDCYWSYIRNDHTLNSLHNAGQWQDLAISTMQIGHENDSAYYYLGRAAEELGHLQAAEKYYLYSAALYDDAVSQHHCREMSSCYVDVYNVVPRRLELVRKKIAAAKVVIVSPPQPKQSDESAHRRPRVRAITEDMVKDAKLKAEDGSFRQFADGQYRNGFSADDPRYLIGTIERVLIGDLNRDGVADAVVIYWFGNGSAIKKYYIGMVVGGSGQMSVATPMYVGDRLVVESFALRSGRATLRARVWASPTRTRDITGSFALERGKVVFR